VKSLVVGGCETKLELHNAGGMMQKLKLVSKVFLKLVATRVSQLVEKILALQSHCKVARKNPAV
jgi:hypothetical protein